MANNFFGLAFLAFLAIYVGWIFFFSEGIAQSVMQAPNVLNGVFWYVVTQPTYLFIVLGIIIYGQKRIGLPKAVLAGLLISSALDMVDTPHCVPSTGLPTEAVNYLCADTVVIQFFGGLMPFGIAHVLYYLVLPILFLVIAFDLLGVKFVGVVLKGK